MIPRFSRFRMDRVYAGGENPQVYSIAMGGEDPKLFPLGAISPHLKPISPPLTHHFTPFKSHFTPSPPI